MIEGTAACARDMHVQAIVGTAAVLAPIEAETQEVPLHPPRLRDAVENKGPEAVAVWIGRGGRAQERRHVARCEEAEAGHRGPVGVVDELVDAPRFEAALEPDVLARWLHRGRGGLARKAPSRARNQGVLTILPVADEETRVELLTGRSRERPMDAVGEQAGRATLVWPHLNHGLAADGVARLKGRRCGEAQELRARVDVPLPADGGNAVAAGEQEAVARMRLWPHGRVGRRAIHHGNDAATAAVREFNDAAAVRSRGIERLQQGEIGRELDQSRRIARRQL
jgi:hypothetical protein